MFGSQDSIKPLEKADEDGIDWDALIEEAEDEEERIGSQLEAINDSFNFDQSQFCTPLPPNEDRKRECPAVERKGGKVIGEMGSIFTLDGLVNDEEDFDFHL